MLRRFTMTWGGPDERPSSAMAVNQTNVASPPPHVQAPAEGLMNAEIRSRDGRKTSRPRSKEVRVPGSAQTQPVTTGRLKFLQGEPGPPIPRAIDPGEQREVRV